VDTGFPKKIMLHQNARAPNRFNLNGWRSSAFTHLFDALWRASKDAAEVQIEIGFIDFENI
jgi:hypothetical protein